MTTPSTTAARGHDVRRLTVAGPTGRADLAVPATVTLAGLLPVLLRHVAGPEAHGGGWVLQRLGEAPSTRTAPPRPSTCATATSSTCAPPNPRSPRSTSTTSPRASPR